MKLIVFFLCLLVIWPPGKEDRNYTGSTPASSTVRDFLGIDQKDSIDFIRWQLNMTDLKMFALSCSYGIGKPNTNGFIDEKKLAFRGEANFNEDILTLTHNRKSLSLLVINQNIMHILDTDGSMMKGNGGWSYTLNSLNIIQTNAIRIKPHNLGFTDSLVFEGRTPCRGVEEILDGKSRPECYKKKWLVRLYKNNPNASSGTYTIGRNEKAGKWKSKKDKSGGIVYSLDMNNGHLLELLHTDEKVVYIMDGKGGIFTGDHDFSYSLNRR